MHADAEGFMRAICAAPDDDTPRLVYADWLDEHGESDRAEFIRAQIAYSHETRKTYLPKLERRIRNVMKGAITMRRLPWVNEWLDGPFKCGIRMDGWGYSVVPVTPAVDFTRGFVSAVTCTAADWLAHWQAIAWKPGWKVACPRCNGATYTHREGDPDDVQDVGGPMDCKRCQDAESGVITGTVDAPFSPTCQPTERVTLTALEPGPRGGLLIGGSLLRQIAGTINDWECDRWPCIVFTLPGP